MGKTIMGGLLQVAVREQWLIAWRRKVDISTPFTEKTVVRPPADRFYADPFLLERAGRVYLFFEEFRYKAKKGVISCLEVNDGAMTEPKVILEEPFHLSYPFLLAWKGDIYLIPESSHKRQIIAYRATRFPHRWVKHAVLMDNVYAVDPTIVYHKDRWWLFAAGFSDADATNRDLFVFSSDAPFGPWVPHDNNPVIRDKSRARPGGAFFRTDGILLRPSQDCAITYGRSVLLNRVDILTQSEYRESTIGTIEPSWCTGNRGTHTYNASENFEVIDGRLWIPRWPSMSRRSE